MKTIHIEVNDFLAAIIGIAAGVLLVIFPQESLNVITYGIGIISLVYGVLRIISYFRNKSLSPFFAGELFLGIVLVAIGLFSFLNPGGIFAVLPIVLGILVLVEGQLPAYVLPHTPASSKAQTAPKAARLTAAARTAA